MAMPPYRYRPAVSGSDPKLRTRSNRRARLWAGGTYFRAREPGLHGNSISLEVQEWVSTLPGEEGTKKGKLIVTNHTTAYDENVTGPVDVLALNQQLNWDERFVIDNLTTRPRALRYSISLQLAVAQSLQEDLGPFTFPVLYVADKVFAKLAPRTAEFTPTSVITIKPRTRVYDLALISKTVTDQSGAQVPTEGWDIAPLREAVNANDPWIEMRPRSAAPDPGTPGVQPTLIDAQDDQQDADFLTAFPDTYMEGGDGLPDSPSGERTGPSRSLIHINYGEKYDGTLGEVNEVYEWVGDSATAGEWKRY